MSGVVSIEGNLGAGKSTLLSLLNISTIKEPVDEWANMSGGNILKNYYMDPKRWAFTFQLHALHSRHLLWQQQTKLHPNTLLFSERSPLADRHVFGELMHREGNLEAAEYDIYSQLCEKLVGETPLRGIVYLRCPPELCLERIKIRHREGEEGIPLSYLRKVHQRHEDWLMELKHLPILTVDTALYDLSLPEHQKEVAVFIRNFIASLQPPKSEETPSSLPVMEEEVQVTA